MTLRDHKGEPFYEAKFRHAGKQVKRRIGRAWLTRHGAGGWVPRRGLVADGYLDERRAHVAAAELVRSYVKGEIIDEIEVDLDRLPEELDELKPLIRRWAKSDDVEREQAQEGASIEDLQALWSAVQPRFAVINEYLDEPDDDEAHLLGNLAEAAMEAASEIKQRAGTNPLS